MFGIVDFEFGQAMVIGAAFVFACLAAKRIIDFAVETRFAE